MLASFAFVTAAGAAPPTSRQATVGTLLSGLINANVQNIAVNVGDITITDVVDVSNVLNNNQVEILKNVLNNSPIASNNSDFLNNLLRDANLITDNQIVVGVLGGTFFVTNLVP
jgi:hypothetical protein